MHVPQDPHYSFIASEKTWGQMSTQRRGTETDKFGCNRGVSGGSGT